MPLKLKLLHVEDSKNFRLVFGKLLEDHYRAVVIEEASTGKEALRKMRISMPHIVVMDVNLPDSNGLEITKNIRALYGSRVSIIVLTSQDPYQLKKTALACGADAFFEKGTSIADLSQAINRLLKLKPVHA